MSSWSNLPEGLVKLVASRCDGPRSDVIRALRGVCKPWSAEITAGITKATTIEWADAPVWQVLQKTPKLRSLTVVGSQGETLLAEIRIVKKLVPELKSFVFKNCDLTNNRMPLSLCLGEHTQELTLDYCDFDDCSFEDIENFRHLTYLKFVPKNIDVDDEDEQEMKRFIWKTIFTELPSLQSLCIMYYYTETDNSIQSNLPNLTSLIINYSYINCPGVLRGLFRLEHLDLKGIRSEASIDFELLLPKSITSLNIYDSELSEYPNNYKGVAERLKSLTSLHIGRDWRVTDEELAAFGSMPSLTRLSVADCDNVTDNGLMNLARSASLTWLEIKRMRGCHTGGVDALRAAAPSIEIVFEAM